MRILIVGAGGIGGVLAGGLLDAGHTVRIVARGAHGEALIANGLTVAHPGGTRTYRVESTLTVPAGLDLDAILLCVKSQDTASAGRDLLGAGYGEVPVVCAQNGVTNERHLAGSFQSVYGMMVWMPATHLEPGVVEVHAEKPAAQLMVGRFPEGIDGLALDLVKALGESGFGARAVADIDAWKHGKLLLNLGNAIDAFCQSFDKAHPFRAALEAEAGGVFRAAGLEFIDRSELLAATAHVVLAEVIGRRRQGGSTWQGAMRGRPNEVGYLNGYVCDLGERLGVPTPWNRVLVDMARSNPAPRSVDLETLLPTFPPG